MNKRNKQIHDNPGGDIFAHKYKMRNMTRSSQSPGSLSTDSRLGTHHPQLISLKINFINTLSFYFLAMLCGLRDLSSPARDQIWALAV